MTSSFAGRDEVAHNLDNTFPEAVRLYSPPLSFGLREEVIVSPYVAGKLLSDLRE